MRVRGVGPLWGSTSVFFTISTETRSKIEEEIVRLLRESRGRVVKLLSENRKDLEVVATSLLQYETLTGEELKQLVRFWERVLCFI